MLTKKQYFLILLGAALIFILAFLVFYNYISDNAFILRNKDKGTEVQAPQNSVQEVAQYQQDRILPTTEIYISLEDNKNNLIEKEKIDPVSLLNLTKDEVQKRFADYEVVDFDSSKVSIKKVIEEEPLKEYRLGTKDDKVCIIEDGEEKQYIPLDLSVQEISAYLYHQLLTEQIKITKEQKDILQQSPYFIEQMLQNSEEQ